MPICFGVFSLALIMLLGGCAQAPRRGEIIATNRMRVRTTAYTGTFNAISRRLSHGLVTSAASDWSQFPVGTRFRIRQTGQLYEIDDYGSALVGTRTIDLCMPCARVMHQWGVRWVDIDVLQWGSPRRSLEILAPREKAHIVRRMTAVLRRQAGGIPGKFHRLPTDSP